MTSENEKMAAVLKAEGKGALTDCIMSKHLMFGVFCVALFVIIYPDNKVGCQAGIRPLLTRR